MATITARSDDPTTSDHVTLSDVDPTDTDPDLARLAGYSIRHFGYNVIRYPDQRTALVVLWNT